MGLEDLEKFDTYLDSLYIKKKTDRKKIISLYKRSFKQKKNILDFEKELEKLNWDEITIDNIAYYVTNWNYRDRENKRLNKKIEKDSNDEYRKL